MSVLVTGGAGFIGSHVLDALADRKATVICLDNFNDYYSERRKHANIADAMASGCVELVEGDIRDKGLCERVFSKYDVEKVIHLAARAGVRPSIEAPLLYEEVNCRGTLNLLESAARAKVAMFVFGSSSSVYGMNETPPFREDAAADRPISPYAATKRAGELLCHTYHHLYRLPVVVLRFFTVYGPRQRPDLAINKFVDLIEQGKPVPLYGDGSSKRDYTYITDVVDGILAALDSSLEFEIINLGNSTPVSLQDMVSTIAQVMKCRVERKHLEEQPGDVPLTYADIGKARKLLGYKPSVSFEEGIEYFVEWYRENVSYVC
jgi:UDP-glucuronate 4-epimerase